jgi:hypothetical protein
MASCTLTVTSTFSKTSFFFIVKVIGNWSYVCIFELLIYRWCHNKQLCCNINLQDSLEILHQINTESKCSIRNEKKLLNDLNGFFPPSLDNT